MVQVSCKMMINKGSFMLASHCGSKPEYRSRSVATHCICVEIDLTFLKCSNCTESFEIYVAKSVHQNLCLDTREFHMRTKSLFGHRVMNAMTAAEI